MGYSKKLYDEFARSKGHFKVVRRGEKVLIGRAISLKINKLNKLKFEVSHLSKNTKKVVYVDVAQEHKHFNFRLEKKLGEAKVYFSPTINTPLNNYSIVVSKMKNNTLKQVFSLEVLVIANADHDGDQVYLDSITEKQEFIYDTTTLIFQGSFYKPVAKKWYLDQYEEPVLRTVIVLLNFMSDKDKSTIADLVRKLAELLNFNEKGSFIMPKWAEPFTDGLHPDYWCGSGELLKQYFSEHCPVRFGQCASFAGLFCSFARCLGIPCRIVTNYLSFHNTEGVLTYEKKITDEGFIHNNRQDQVWSYHCWNECYFKSYGGGKSLNADPDWQIIDASPQVLTKMGSAPELVTGAVFKLGPASRTCVKNGTINVGHDTGFFFSEINTDVFYVIDDCVIYTEQLSPLICTKRVGSDDYDNLVSYYKYENKGYNFVIASKEEYQKRYKVSLSSKNLALQIHPFGGNFCFTTEHNMLKIRVCHIDNDTVDVSFVTVGQLNLACYIYTYNGQLLQMFDRQKISLDNATFNEGYFDVQVDVSNFESLCSESAKYVKFSCFYFTDDSVNYAIAEMLLHIDYGEILIEYDPQIECKNPTKFLITFKNFFKSCSLTNVVLHIYIKPEPCYCEKMQLLDLEAGSSVRVTKEVKFFRSGTYNLLFKVKADRIPFLVKTLDIQVN